MFLHFDGQVNLATELLPNPAEQVKRLGSVMVCEAKDVEEMKAECSRLQELGCECRWMGREEIQALPGAAVGFDAGIWFPHDAIIDSTAYAQARSSHVRRAARTSGARVHNLHRAKKANETGETDEDKLRACCGPRRGRAHGFRSSRFPKGPRHIACACASAPVPATVSLGA